MKATAFGLTGVALTNPFNAGANSQQTSFYISGANNGSMTNVLDAIQKIRIRDIEIQVFDRLGNPLKNHSVEIVLNKHAFLFGDCM